MNRKNKSLDKRRRGSQRLAAGRNINPACKVCAHDAACGRWRLCAPCMQKMFEQNKSRNLSRQNKSLDKRRSGSQWPPMPFDLAALDRPKRPRAARGRSCFYGARLALICGIIFHFAFILLSAHSSNLTYVLCVRSYITLVARYNRPN